MSRDGMTVLIMEDLITIMETLITIMKIIKENLITFMKIIMEGLPTITEIIMEDLTTMMKIIMEDLTTIMKIITITEAFSNIKKNIILKPITKNLKIKKDPIMVNIISTRKHLINTF